MLTIPKDKICGAQSIIDREVKKLEEDEDVGYFGADINIQEEGVWFHSPDGSFYPEHVEVVARALIEELELDDPFICSWAYTCSKPRIDEFGGGAFIIERGKETIWCDALTCVKREAIKRLIPQPQSEEEK
jgi:hypothetical protein